MSAISSVPSRSSAPVLAPVPDAGHDHGWAHVLRERGLRATRAGVRVLEIVHEARVPLSHDDLMQALQVLPLQLQAITFVRDQQSIPCQPEAFLPARRQPVQQ